MPSSTARCRASRSTCSGTDTVTLAIDRWFATAVDSPADDYRYGALDGHEPAMTAYDLPDGLGCLLVGLARSMGLLVAGADLRVTPDGLRLRADERAIEALTLELARAGVALRALVPDAASLEERFFALTEDADQPAAPVAERELGQVA